MSEDPNAAADPEQQEQMRQYVEQLRAAEPAEIIAQAFTMMGTGAEVKIGRSDARVLIDALAGLVSAVEERLPDQLANGMREGLAQLQQAQVQAESQAGQQAQPGAEAPPAEPASGTSPQGGQGQGGDESSMTDRLWVPGRDAPPPTR